ncbi:MAG: biotin/lipoyl-binding protein, partial [Deltaproteobacteria bacterium]|nr:biotin/lipoyl-binding protein [Deltaproteobacteria bacterium]
MPRAHPSAAWLRGNAARLQAFFRAPAALAPAALAPAALALALLLAAGCERGEGDAAPEEESEPTAVRVEAVTVVPELLVHRVALTGQLVAEHTVMVKSEIEGVIASVHGEEGQPVAKGDLLFHLRDGRQRARLHEAKAQLALA